MGNFEQYQDFDAIHVRLQEIVEAVGDDDLPLDDALDLYEEAVALGLRVSDLLEEGIELPDATDESDEPGAAAAAAAESPAPMSEPRAEAAASAE